MPYEIKWAEKAIIELEKLDKTLAKRIIKKIESIADDPFSFVIKLRGFELYRLRVGRYRIIMSIENKKMIIFVLEVGHRSSIYRKY